jgi:V8-like Glu-specific endopeptidase
MNKKWRVILSLIGATFAFSASQAGSINATQPAEVPTHSPESLGQRPLDGYEKIRYWAHDSIFYQAGSSAGFIDTELIDGGHIECSGMAVSANLVLTARHCVRDPTRKPYPIRSIHFWLADSHIDGGMGNPHSLKTKEVDVGTEADDDFALLSADTAFDLKAIRTPPLGSDPTPNQHLYIYHYPYGQPETITRYKCAAAEQATDAPNTPPIGPEILKHTCDTQPGSSGGAILNESFQIVAIHVADGRSEKSGSFNEGLLISRIIKVSPTLKAALAKNAGGTVHIAEAAVVEPSTASYTTDKGDQFLLAGAQWYLVPKDKPRIPLKQQGAAGDSLILWDPRPDLNYEIPLAGGIARVRSAKGGPASEVFEVKRQ